MSNPLNDPNNLNIPSEGKQEKTRQEKKIFKYKKDLYIQKRIKAGWFYFLNYYFFVTASITALLLILGVIFILPHIDSFKEIPEAFKEAINYINITEG